MIRYILISSLLGLGLTVSLYGQSLDQKYGEDVKSIEAIIDAYYEVVSGSSTDPWQFERDRYIHTADAVITKIDENGVLDSHSLEAEYIPFLLVPRESFYEIELKRFTRHYGNMAQVWSAYEVRTEPEVPTQIRGLNNIQLHFHSGRWWINSWTSEMETNANPLVKEFLENE